MQVDPLDAFMSDFIVPEAQKQIDIAKQTAAEIDKQKAKVPLTNL